MAYVPYCAYCVVVFVVFVCVCVWRALWEGGEGVVLNFMLSTHSPGHTLHGVDSSQHDTRRVVLRSVWFTGSAFARLRYWSSARSKIWIPMPMLSDTRLGTLAPLWFVSVGNCVAGFRRWCQTKGFRSPGI